MACEVCEHCQSPMSRNDKITVREGFSYHKRCHKCYVCSETDLHNAEVFKGVIFCCRCAQRIFQGCSTARRTKNMHSHKGRKTRSKSHRRERVKGLERKLDRSRDGVIELARLAASITTDSEDQKEVIIKKPGERVMVISENALQVEKNKRIENCFYYQTMGHIKRKSPEIGTTTDVTQELLKTIMSLMDGKNPNPIVPAKPQVSEIPQVAEVPHVPEVRQQSHVPRVLTVPYRRKHYRRKRETHIPIKKKPSCSDPRIAELGISTEIANMALRKNSELPGTVQSDTRFKARDTSYTVSGLNVKSDRSGEGPWSDSAYSTIEESESTNLMDKRLGSLLKMPLKLFKKKILTRSSLVSVLISSNGGSINIIQRMKQLLHAESLDHQARGMRRLYSTINRRKKPFRLGWVPLVTRAYRLNLFTGASRSATCTCEKRCKHFRHSHSYRCMRAHVMKLAGPTTSELALYRQKIKQFIAPQCLRNFFTFNYPAVKLSAACQISNNANTEKSQ